MTTPPSVNNAFYDTLGDRWFDDDSHPVALLRAENALKLDYLLGALARHGVRPGARVLDVGCGAGLLALPLAERGYRVEGVDASAGSLDVARRRVSAGTEATFRVGDATALDAPGDAYDAVLLLDVLDHLERPDLALAEAARVVRPGGLVAFSTFNRTPASWLLAVHGFRFVVRDVPDRVHVWRLFVPPTELAATCDGLGLTVREIVGTRPRFGLGFWRALARRRIGPDFRFTLTRSLAVGYVGVALAAPRPHGTFPL